jgi:hypothetical protein
VSRWQESLPPFELIEPNCYGSFDCHSSGSKTASHNFIKKFASPGGHENGCPESELCHFPVQPDSLKFSGSQSTKCKTDLEAKDMSLQTEPKEVAQHTDHKVAFQSLPHNKTVSDSGRMLDNFSDLHFLAVVSDNMKQSECSQSTTVPKLLNMHSLDCWDLEMKPSGDITNSSASLHLCDQKPKNIYPDFHVPPLKLGSLLGGGDGNDRDADGVNGGNSSDVTIVSEREETSKARLYSGYKESFSSSCQVTSEGITYPFSTSDSQAFETLNKEKVASNKMCLLSGESHTDFQGKCTLLKTHGKAADRRQHNNINPINNYFSERRMNLATVQNDSLEGSAETSTTYRSLQLCKTVREIKHTSSQQYYGRKPTHLDVTDDHNILNHIPVHTERHESSARHAVGVIESDISRRKLLGSALRYLLLAFFSTEQCLDNSCICHRSSSKPVTPRNHSHTSVENENIASERDSRNVCHVGNHVNLTSTLSDIDCGAKRTLTTDGIVNSVMEAAGSESSDSFRYM